MIELFVAFGAGLISFLSPCVLPLIPGYISYISGSSMNELMEKKNAIFDESIGGRNAGVIGALVTHCSGGGKCHGAAISYFFSVHKTSTRKYIPNIQKSK